MLINFKKMLCKTLYNKLLQRIKTLEKRLFECYKRLFECFFRLKKRLFECLRRHTFLNVVFNFYICEHSFCRFLKTKEYGYKNNKQRCDTELFNDCI